MTDAPELDELIDEWICPRCDRRGRGTAPVDHWEGEFVVVTPDSEMVHPDCVRPGDYFVEYDVEGHSGGGDPRDVDVTYHVERVIGRIEPVEEWDDD